MPKVLNKYTDKVIITSDDVYCGRPSKWGNPFVIGKDGSRDDVCEKFEDWFIQQRHLLRALPEIRGKNLICFCAPQRCHCHTLIKYANLPQYEFDELMSALDVA